MKETTSVSNLTIYFFREKSDHFWNKEKRVIDEFLLKKRKLDAKSYLIDGLIARYGPREDHGPYVNEIRFADDDLWLWGESGLGPLVGPPAVIVGLQGIIAGCSDDGRSP